MKQKLILACLVTSLTSTLCYASLEEDLDALKIPGNQAPAGVTQEKLYSVQERLNPLAHQSELSLGVGKNLTADAFIDTQEAFAGYRYNLSNQWFLGAGANMVFNSLSGAGQRLREIDQVVPDSTYSKYRFDAHAGLNLFYGKFRVSNEKVFYFDQYLTLGPGLVMNEVESAPAAVGEVGISLWTANRTSVRVGLKDYLFQEKRILSQGLVNHLVAQISVGILLGDSK